MPKFKRSRHLGKRSIEVLDQELESLLNQWRPHTLTLKELREFKEVYKQITDDVLKQTTPANLQRKLNYIEIKFKQIDKDWELPAFTRD